VLRALGEDQNWEDNYLCFPVGGIQERSSGDEASVLIAYPNPANQSIILSGFELDGLEKTVELFSVTGKRVLLVSLSASQNSVEISTRQLSNGLYLYRANAPNKTYLPGKIVVAH
jgi:hypothetical protein